MEEGERDTNWSAMELLSGQWWCGYPLVSEGGWSVKGLLSVKRGGGGVTQWSVKEGITDGQWTGVTQWSVKVGITDRQWWGYCQWMEVTQWSLKEWVGYWWSMTGLLSVNGGYPMVSKGVGYWWSMMGLLSVNGGYPMVSEGGGIQSY